MVLLRHLNANDLTAYPYAAARRAVNRVGINFELTCLTEFVAARAFDALWGRRYGIESPRALFIR